MHDSRGVACHAVTSERPDGRVFVRPGRGQVLDGALALAIAKTLGESLYAVARDDGDRDLLTAAGFEVDVAEEAFAVPFESALERLGGRGVPRGFVIRSALEVPLEELVALDDELRNDVPGTDGWRGTVEAMRGDLAESPPFDPEAYLVASRRADGRHAGLVRIWRNPSGPRFGMIGVRREFRRTTIGAALIGLALQAAAQWGHEEFVTETALTNRIIYSRLDRLASRRLGRFYQMVLHPDENPA